MFGNPKWFKRRKYSGWGLTPASWQGWVYTLGIVGLLISMMFIAQRFDLSAVNVSVIVFIALGLLSAEVIHIAAGMPKDERETTHEALAERNALWVVMPIVVFGILYQAMTSQSTGTLSVDPFLIAAMIGGVVAKAMTNLYLQDK